MADNLPAVRLPFLARVRRALELIVNPVEFDAGPLWDEANRARDEYDKRTAMSAYGGVALVHACALRIASDVARLPLKVYRGDALLTERHPILDVLDEPTRGIGGVVWRRQMLVDLVCTGTYAALWVWGPSDGSRPDRLVRWHPDEWEIRPAKDGGIAAFRYDERDYSPEDVLYVTDPSWDKGPRSLVGSSHIQPIHSDLNASEAAAKAAAEAAKRGRLEALLSPTMPEVTWNAEQTRRILTAWTQSRTNGSGAIVMPGAVGVEPLSLSPRDLEFAAIDEQATRKILAVLQVPPSILGIPGANYATDRQQAKIYWGGNVARAELIAGALTRIARKVYGDPALRVAFDFSTVEALQLSRTERLNRATSHILNGIDPAKAYQLEGFDDVEPSDFGVFGAPEGEPATVDTPSEPDPEPADERAARPVRRSPACRLEGESLDACIERKVPEILAENPGMDEDQAVAIAANLCGEMCSTTAGPPDMTTEEGRATEWRRWLDDVHAPAERRIGRAMTRYLRQAADRYADRAADVLGEGRSIDELTVRTVGPDNVTRRELTPAVADALLAEAEERGILRDTLGPLFRAIVARAFAESVGRIAAATSLEWDPERSSVVRLVDEFVVNVGSYTAEKVRSIVEAGLEAGASTSDIQAELIEDAAFSPTRALRIARTEATRTAEAGNAQAVQQLRDDVGARVTREWLTARDSHVRDGHRSLDGQTAAPGEVFTVSAGRYIGAQGTGPGQFAQAGLVVNCRCRTIPKLLDDPEEDA